MASKEQFLALETLFNNFYKYFPPKKVLSKGIATRLVFAASNANTDKISYVKREELHSANDFRGLD